MKKLERAIARIERCLGPTGDAAVRAGLHHALAICRDVRDGRIDPLIELPAKQPTNREPPADIAMDVRRHWILNWETGKCIAVGTQRGNLKTVVY